MGTATNIVAGIAGVITSTLGADYTELAYGTDVAKNKLLGGTKGYAILPADIDQLSGVTNYVTVNQLYEVILTESYGQSKLGDEAQRQTAVTLFDRMETLYRAIQVNKAGVPASVISVGSLTVARPEFLDSNLAVLRATITIQYRTAL